MDSSFRLQVLRYIVQGRYTGYRAKVQSTAGQGTEYRGRDTEYRGRDTEYKGRGAEYKGPSNILVANQIGSGQTPSCCLQ